MDTVAFRIASTFCGGMPDGQRYTSTEGQGLDEALRAAGAKVTRPKVGDHPYTLGDGAAVLYTFDDGSAVVDLGDAWDFRAAGCGACCWDGIGCRCADEAQAYVLHTTHGAASFETLTDAAAWLAEHQPSGVRVTHNGLECEVEWTTQDDDEAELEEIERAIKAELADEAAFRA